MIVKSANQKEIAEGRYAVHLGKRIQHVHIVNERDCIKVKPKGWLDKQIWKEINDILKECISLHGYQTARIAVRHKDVKRSYLGVKKTN